MTEDLVVEVLEGKHSRPAPAGTKETFEDLMKKAGFTKGFFKVLLGRQIRGACEAKKIMVHNLDEQTGTIMIKAQIDGRKDQRFETFLTLPNNFKQKPEVFLTALERGAELVNNPPIVKNLASDVCEKQSETTKDQVPKKSETSKKSRSLKGDLEHIIAGEETILIFWNEIEDMFEDNGTIRRKKLIDNFLIRHGSEPSCYRFISKLIRLRIFGEIKYPGENRKDLIVGERLGEIINKFQKEEVKKEQPSEGFPPGSYAEKISKLESMVKEKKDVENLLEEKETRVRSLEEKIKALNLEIEDLKKWITPEMLEAEEKLEALRKILE